MNSCENIGEEQNGKQNDFFIPFLSPEVVIIDIWSVRSS